jgi:hypothetical protein
LIDNDKLNSADPKKVGHAVMHMADRLQAFQPETQVIAAAAFFLFLAERHRVPAQDAFTITKNLLASSLDGTQPELGAAQDYVRHEL